MKKLRRLKALLLFVWKVRLFIQLEIRQNCVELGSPYGRWCVIPGLLGKESIVYSFGIGEDLSFDFSLIEKFDLVVQGFDPTPKSVEWVKRQDCPEQFILNEYGVSESDGVLRFFAPKDKSHVSHSTVPASHLENQFIEVPCKSLHSIMLEKKHTELDVLKMDIEGSEYSVLSALLRSDLRPKQLLVEFHFRFSKDYTEKTRLAFRDLKKAGYQIFWVSDRYEEFAFLYTGTR